ncbi:acyltransferase family protein [Paenibacillus glacialis]|nr:acyltransferase [Paenibacillus glacialis]
MRNRIEQLDSIRGLAAVTVVFGHILLVSEIPVLSAMTSIYSPLSIITNGHSAVMMFFLLSGFVLSLPFLKGRNIPYGAFIIKRFFRIYIPYVCSIISAIVLYSLISGGGITSLSEWFNISWNDPITVKSIVEHLLLIGNFNSDLYNNVIWSLIHEMRISILFPLLAILLVKFNWKIVVGMCIGLSVISGMNSLIPIDPSIGYRTSYMESIHFISIFLIGGLIAKHREALQNIYNNFSRKMKWLLILVGFILYTYSGFVGLIGSALGLSVYYDIIKDYTSVAGAAIFLVFALGSKKASFVLLYKPIKVLGKLSYSLYLYHLIVLFSLIYILHEVLSLGLIYIMTLIISIILSALSYRFIEVSSITIGRNLTSKSQKNLIEGSVVQKSNPVEHI